jgi:tRNA pseudouridine38-40 synthase
LNNYRLTIQYDGGRYKGWQRLGQGENTVQYRLEQLLSSLTGEEVELIGCSRTDAGVHALGQTANFKTSRLLSGEQILKYANQYLPKDICIIDAVPVEEAFHARYHAKDKTYLYQIWNKEYSNPFLRKYSMHVPEKLDLELMKAAAGYFLGAHDFTAFQMPNPRRNPWFVLFMIFNSGIGWTNQASNQRDGFLYNMARWMVGTLVEVGLGRMKRRNSLTSLLRSRDIVPVILRMPVVFILKRLHMSKCLHLLIFVPD